MESNYETFVSDIETISGIKFFGQIHNNMFSIIATIRGYYNLVGLNYLLGLI